MDYVKQPPKDFKATMDYKSDQIRRFADDKQEGIKISSSGRDATLIVVNMYHPMRTKEMTDEEIKEKLIFWRDWVYENIYTIDDNKFKQLNRPF